MDAWTAARKAECWAASMDEHSVAQLAVCWVVLMGERMVATMDASKAVNSAAH